MVIKMIKVLVMMVMMVMKMMIPMKPSSMAMTMAMISPLWEGISPVDFYLPKSFLSLCVFRLAEAAGSISDPPSGLRFSGMTTYVRRCWKKWARAATPLGGMA
jgi:hypothetical protein